MRSGNEQARPILDRFDDRATQSRVEILWAFWQTHDEARLALARCGSVASVKRWARENRLNAEWVVRAAVALRDRGLCGPWNGRQLLFPGVVATALAPPPAPRMRSNNPELDEFFASQETMRGDLKTVIDAQPIEADPRRETLDGFLTRARDHYAASWRRAGRPRAPKRDELVLHALWFVRFQVGGESAAAIASTAGAVTTPKAVAIAVRRLAERVGLRLRTNKRA